MTKKGSFSGAPTGVPRVKKPAGKRVFGPMSLRTSPGQKCTTALKKWSIEGGPSGGPSGGSEGLGGDPGIWRQKGWIMEILDLPDGNHKIWDLAHGIQGSEVLQE